VSDEILWEILEELSAKEERGERADVEMYVARHPDLASELRELWGAATLAKEVGRIASDDPSSITLPVSDVAPTSDADVPRVPDRIGDYEILEELGRGGMGIVYRARQSGLERSVALKAIRAGAMASRADVTRFRVEAQSAAKLEHPGIVPVYDVGEDDGQPYFTMQLIEGTTLSARLADGPMSASEVVKLLAPVARAIDFAHQGGVLHRDLKPANILIDEDGHPFVADFGLAKRLEADESLTQSGAVLGTPSYMAPEQAAGSRGEVSAVTDVYALGAVLYHALTGRPPFQSPSPIETILQVLEQDPLPPRLLNPQIDRDLEMIVLRCLQKPPEMRYASAAALADDLEAYLADEPLSARSGNILDVISRMFRETHHASILENWGLLWIWHSIVLLILCVFTNWLHWEGVHYAGPYLAVWTVGLGTWAAIFWGLRRRAGPVTFVERQIAHIWGASIICCVGLYFVEMLLGLEVLRLTPLLGLFSGTVFFTKASILTGKFYVQAGALYLSVVPMALYPDFGLTIFGVVSAFCFAVPGFRYWRQRGRR
jgi:serine/threonine-protein kinase